jgi:GT2 family glycosyltransferase
MTSICVVTLDRTELARKCVSRALSAAGAESELLWADNGSQEQDVIAFMQSCNPVYARLNPTNEGYAKMLNQLRLRAKGDYICIIDPDIFLPMDWLYHLVEANEAIPNSGISGIHCVMEIKNPVLVVNGISIYAQEEIHGIKFFNRAAGEKVGFYHPDFPAYGNEDVEMNRRMKMAGFMNYYLADFKSEHLGDDCGATTPYRKMKWDLLRGPGHEVLTRRLKYLEETGDYYVPPPELY